MGAASLSRNLHKFFVNDTELLQSLDDFSRAVIFLFRQGMAEGIRVHRFIHCDLNDRRHHHIAGLQRHALELDVAQYLARRRNYWEVTEISVRALSISS